MTVWTDLRAWAFGIVLTSLCPFLTQGAETESLANDTRLLCRQYVAGFGSDQTELVYHHRLDGLRGVAALSSPEEIAAGTVSGKHKALVSEDEQVVCEAAPYVRRMVRIMLDHGQHYERGENFNRTVVLALLLWAAETRDGHAS